MELIAPTNFDDDLALEFKKTGVKEVYGKLPIDEIGGGRIAYCLPNVSKKRLAEHIRRLHRSDIKFNYLLNSACLGFKEFTRRGTKQINGLLDWLVSIGVDKVTVTIPFLAQIIKDNYPQLSICVSTFANVDSVQKAIFWQQIGADEITLSHTSLNRDFEQLKLIRRLVQCKLRLIANSACLYKCPLFQYHSLWDSHGSQREYANNPSFMVNYCIFFCWYLRFLEPVRFIRSQWIRPEDLSVYEEIGIDRIKLIDRRCSSKKIVQIVRSYKERRYQGNLLDLLPLFHGKTPLDKSSLYLKFKYFFHPLEPTFYDIPKLNRLTQGVNIHIDNKKLDGFIKKFIDNDCSRQDCSRCGHCEQFAKSAVSYDEAYLEQMQNNYRTFLDSSRSLICDKKLPL